MNKTVYEPGYLDVNISHSTFHMYWFVVEHTSNGYIWATWEAQLLGRCVSSRS